MMLVDEFSGLLKRKMGLDSRSIGAAAVERAVRHRMSATGVDDERDYLMRVQASPAEMQLLIESVVVPETWFFRYPESQQAMAQLACERLFGAGAADERVLRVLSLPCSSGEAVFHRHGPAGRRRAGLALPDRCAGHQRARGPVRAPGPVRAQFLPWRRAGLPGPLFHRDRRRPPAVRAGDGAGALPVGQSVRRRPAGPRAGLRLRVLPQPVDLFRSGYPGARRAGAQASHARGWRAVRGPGRNQPAHGAPVAAGGDAALLRLPGAAAPRCGAAAASLFKPAALPAQPASRVPRRARPRRSDPCPIRPALRRRRPRRS